MTSDASMMPKILINFLVSRFAFKVRNEFKYEFTENQAAD
jgi:hypothetical protein